MGIKKIIMDFMEFKKEINFKGIKILTNFYQHFEYDKEKIEKSKKIIENLLTFFKRWTLVNGGVTLTQLNGEWRLTIRISDMYLNGDKMPKDIYEDIVKDFYYYLDKGDENFSKNNTIWSELNSTEEYIIFTIEI
jgi:hypothetical protein